MVARSFHQSSLGDTPGSRMGTVPGAARIGMTTTGVQIQAICSCAAMIIFLSLLAAYVVWA